MPTDRPAPTPSVRERTDARLATLDGVPVDEHVATFDAVHRDLYDMLEGAEAGHEPPPE